MVELHILNEWTVWYVNYISIKWICISLYIKGHASLTLLFPGGASGKELTCQCRRCKKRGFSPWIGMIPWRKAWQPTPEFLPGEFYRQRNLTGYGLLGPKSQPWLQQPGVCSQLLSIILLKLPLKNLSLRIWVERCLKWYHRIWLFLGCEIWKCSF